MFFIYDCKDNLVGNPKGYPTLRGASRQANTRALQDLLWGRFEASKVNGVAPSARVWSIK